MSKKKRKMLQNRAEMAVSSIWYLLVCPLCFDLILNIFLFFIYVSFLPLTYGQEKIKTHYHNSMANTGMKNIEQGILNYEVNINSTF